MLNENVNKVSKTNVSTKQKKGIIITGTIFILLLIIYFAGALFFKNHFLPGIKINGKNVMGKSAPQVKEIITDEVNNYVLTLKERKELSEEIKGKDINLSVSFDNTLDNLIKSQNSFSWIISIFKKNENEVPLQISYDEGALSKVIDSLEAFDPQKVSAPVDAHISEYSSKDGYEIVKEDIGNELVRESFDEAVKDALLNLETNIDLDKKGLYKAPNYTKDSDKTKEAAATMNKYVSSQISYSFGSAKEVVDCSLISQWIYADENLDVQINSDAVKEYVKGLSNNYDTIFTTRTFTSRDGETKTLSQGDYGWWMNVPAETEGLIKDIKTGETKERTPEYYQTADNYSDKDWGDSYVEINLTKQHLWIYSKGQEVLSCDIVSGKPGNGHATPPGIYAVTYTERDARLVGQNYDTKVAYWMPFNEDIGLHDATWQTSFGGNRYLTHGSHGCINMSLSDAKKAFQYVTKGYAVILYK
ncbi:Putative peptidoglycan binding domain-containing protein [Acetitomaculum ruminis DSM 5522]|uniref:Putative peptidoglycan binding domain-containing protein n=1 Tax=Acetitomaculum ruminis DSM 5522 TaxID=1120918 RepID=A0A1I0YMF4_9FIRM|nr:L,D-transpeptidase family protein [Acetitomaculum ruminis]SFB13498.1 Putative peptidoglycan binding domain-containing protein [Acetitomaculum ruminis DSM 5522]